jgi:LPS-assembly protein
MTHRGVDIGGEFRYLEPEYFGAVRANYMPGDRLTDTDRWGLSYSHQGFCRHSCGPDRGGRECQPGQRRHVLARLHQQQHQYQRRCHRHDHRWRRHHTAPVANGRYRRVGAGSIFRFLRVLKWQTLQDVTAPIVPPYDRAPQLTGRYALTNVGGLDWSIDGDFTQFEADRLKTLQPNAQRGVAWLQVSRPWLAPAGFITPKLQLHATSYQFDAALASGKRSADSVVPTFSLDSGLVFERETRLFGRGLVQTLEPRAFYVNTPYRDQTQLPNYDTASNDFNFATIYTENAFVGHDKISDNNLLTLGVSTRYLDADSGAQLARFGLAQRLRFDDQRVTLNSAAAPAKAGFSDVLLGASVNILDSWAFDSTVQYNAKTDQSMRSTWGGVTTRAITGS